MRLLFWFFETGAGKGATAKTRAIKRTLAPKWDEWLQLHSTPVDIQISPVMPFLHTKDDSDQKRAEYVGLVLDTTGKSSKRRCEQM